MSQNQQLEPPPKVIVMDSNGVMKKPILPKAVGMLDVELMEGNGPAGGFAWNITSARRVWTDDPTAISKWSDKPIVDNMMREREILQVVGGSKTFKTWFSLAFAIAIDQGTDFLGHRVNRRKVLYLDYELKESTFKQRMCMLAPSTPRAMDYQCLRGHGRLPTIAEIKELIEREDYDVVFIDSLYRTGWITEENSNDAVSRELTPLQALTTDTGASLVIVDHTAKGAGAERSAVDSSRGAGSKGAFFDTILVLRPAESKEEGERRSVLDIESRDWPSQDKKPILSYTFTKSSCKISVVGEADEKDMDGSRATVFEAVANAGTVGMSISEVEAATKKSNGTVSRLLKALAADGKVIRFFGPEHKTRQMFRVPELVEDGNFGPSAGEREGGEEAPDITTML